jgi:hypothetical protein
MRKAAYLMLALISAAWGAQSVQASIRYDYEIKSEDYFASFSAHNHTFIYDEWAIPAETMDFCTVQSFTGEAMYCDIFMVLRDNMDPREQVQYTKAVLSLSIALPETWSGTGHEITYEWWELKNFGIYERHWGLDPMPA